MIRTAHCHGAASLGHALATMRRRAALLASLGLSVALATGCRVEVTNVDVSLSEGADCGNVVLFGLMSVAVEVWSSDDAGDACRIDSRCVDMSGADSVADIEERLADATQPLVDVARQGAERVAIIGYLRNGCLRGDDSPLLCGESDLAEVAGSGVLDIEVTCRRILPVCDGFDVPTCP